MSDYRKVAEGIYDKSTDPVVKLLTKEQFVEIARGVDEYYSDLVEELKAELKLTPH